MMRAVISSFSTKLSCLIKNSSRNLNGNVGSSPSLLMSKPNSVSFTSFTPTVSWPLKGIYNNSKSSLLKTNNPVLVDQTRTLTKFSWKSGTRKSVKVVPKKFFRLHWGIWIRTIAGRHKKLWKKTRRHRNRLLQHVFCNATQSKMLDTMVSKYWRKPKYYIEDPYEFYHKREEFSLTRKKPWRPEGCDYE